MKYIVLWNPVRCFKRLHNPQCLLLGTTGTVLERGTHVYVGAKEKMCYDHNDILAVPYFLDGVDEGFFLYDEVQPSLEAEQSSIPRVN